MATHYKTRGFVFKKEDRSEADRIFTLFTSDFGKIELMARGIRKMTSKLRSGIELFSLSEIEFISSQHRNTLVDAVKIERFPGITEALGKTHVASQASALMNQFIKGQEADAHIWNLLADFFAKLNSHLLTEKNQALAYPYFFWNFISVLGYAPKLFHCASCEKALDPAVIYFSNKEGGVLCVACAGIDSEVKKIHQDIVKILRIILKKDWEILLKLKVEKDRQEGLGQISKEYCNYLLSSRIS
ncbi:DNA repair protein RecO [Candidatus Parcubacteria bacterium]|nr:DNA repair protein RecO [Candidatus Parcubacteria bacterium]